MTLLTSLGTVLDAIPDIGVEIESMLIASFHLENSFVLVATPLPEINVKSVSSARSKIVSAHKASEKSTGKLTCA